jgi:integrase
MLDGRRDLLPFSLPVVLSPDAGMPVSHTAGHIACPACERVRATMVEPGFLASLIFCEAAPIWLESHRPRIGKGTARDYEQCIRSLLGFFARLPLRDIHIGHFEEYQRMRSAGAKPWDRAAGPSRVNHELNTLSQILNRAGLWAPLAAHYHPLPLPRPKVGCALNPDEEARLFRFAASNPRWKLAYWCSLLTANTTAGPAEIRHLRLRDVQLDPPQVHIQEGVKNEYRVRMIPLNEPAAWALRQLLKRARELGCTEPDHYLLPHRARNGARGFDPTRPISSWRGSWDKLREAAELPHLRMYDLRHHAITRLLEDEDVSERTVIEIAGHVSRAMLERYSHIRMRTKREAVDALARKNAQNTVGKAALILVKR